MVVFVEVFGVFGLTILESKTETMCMPIAHESATQIVFKTRSTIGGGGGGCNTFVPVLEGNGTKIAPTRDIFDQPAGQMR